MRAEISAKKLEISTQKPIKIRFSDNSLFITQTMKPYHWYSLSLHIVDSTRNVNK